MMFLSSSSLFLLAALTTIITNVHGHGRLMEPPSRASMWRVGFPTKADYNDNQGWCGGQTYQHQTAGGRCGLCGDPFLDKVKAHEAPGGIYASGIITRTYRPGQDIDVRVDLSANHKGKMEFKICPNNNVKRDPTQACMDAHPLKILPDLKTESPVTTQMGNGAYRFRVRLPRGMTCKQCILQWTYTAGNNYGTCPDGTGGVGCGPQETFRACSDIAIRGRPVQGFAEPITPKPAKPFYNNNPPPNSVNTSGIVGGASGGKKRKLRCRPTPDFRKVKTMYSWCINNCNSDPPNCPSSHCKCKPA